jgi:translation elongation factor EF-G
VWRQADKYRVPRICFINKMDRTGSNFWNCVKMFKTNLGANPCPIQVRTLSVTLLLLNVDLQWKFMGLFWALNGEIGNKKRSYQFRPRFLVSSELFPLLSLFHCILQRQIPIGAEDNFQGIVDLVTMKAWIWKGEDLGATWDEIPVDEAPIDQAVKDEAKEWREKLIEMAVEVRILNYSMNRFSDSIILPSGEKIKSPWVGGRLPRSWSPSLPRIPRQPSKPLYPYTNLFTLITTRWTTTL